MKTINFNMAYEKVGELAKSVNRDYFSIDVSKCSLEGISIRAYIDGYTWTDKRDNLKELFEDVRKMIGSNKVQESKVINLK